MTSLIIVDHPEQWPLKIRSAEVVSADAYLRETRFNDGRRTRVFNLCDSYRYQSVGYYVSLLATARGHRTMPGVTTIQDMKSRSLFRPADDVEELIERALRDAASNRFELSIYFGRTLDGRQADLGRALFNVDRGVEDAVLGDALYDKVMRVFRARVDAAKGGDAARRAEVAKGGDATRRADAGKRAGAAAPAQTGERERQAERADAAKRSRFSR